MFKSSILAALAVSGLLLASSCSTKDDVTKPAPTLTLSSTSTSNVAGAQVSTVVTVNAPEGGKTLTAMVNGVADANFTDGDLGGATTKDVTYQFTIPASAAIAATYSITFQASDKSNQQSAVASFVVTVSAVAPKTITDVGTDGQSTYITENTTWTADKIWRIHGFVRVGKDLARTGTGKEVTGVTLTIEPGTVVYGAPGTPGGTLIIQRGNKIMAQGTADKPIIFTSAKDPNARKAGDWGGVVICGQSKNNVTSASTDGGGTSLALTPGLGELEGGYGGFHGGTDDNDNSGVIKYVRCEYAGYPINPNQELNEFTFGSVGAGTVFSYVQSSFSNDDSFEWFGGSLNCDHIIAYKGLDDDFDTDNGYHGKVQFGLGIRDLNIADQSGSNAFESDNDANGSNYEGFSTGGGNGALANTLPYTTAVFTNMTIIGGKQAFNTPINIQFQNIAQIRRSSKLNIINSFFTGYPNGIYWDANLGTTIKSMNEGIGGSTADGTGLYSLVKNNILAGVQNWGGNGFGSKATADEIAVVDADSAAHGAGFRFPFAVPLTTGSSTLGNANHPIKPIGLRVAGGPGGFSANAFAYSGTGEQQINSVSPIKYFAQNNRVIGAWSDPSLKIDASIFDPLGAGIPTLTPGAGSVLLSGADFTGYTGFTTVTYKGAFDGSNDWTKGWVNWNPQAADYSH